MDEPFREPLAAAHRRIEALEAENAQLRDDGGAAPALRAARRATRLAFTALAVAILASGALAFAVIDLRATDAARASEIAAPRAELPPPVSVSHTESPLQYERARTQLDLASVAAVYRAVLERDATVAESARWTNRAVSASELKRNLASSDEASERIHGLYETYLNRRAEPAGHAFWTSVLGGASLAAVRSGIAGSPEAASKRSQEHPACDPPWDAQGERRAACTAK
jgi:hypothetical protein